MDIDRMMQWVKSLLTNTKQCVGQTLPLPIVPPLTKWMHYCNCDKGHGLAYAQAGRDAGLKVHIGCPDSRGLPSCMYGVYVDADAPKEVMREFERMTWVRRAEYENDPFK